MNSINQHQKVTKENIEIIQAMADSLYWCDGVYCRAVMEDWRDAYEHILDDEAYDVLENKLEEKFGIKNKVIMTREEQDKVLAGIQAALEEMKGTDDDILFLESRNNRGVLSGSIEGLAALFAYNMAVYPQFRIIIEIARQFYQDKKDALERFAALNKPTHEIVDNFGNDIEKMIKNLEK